MKGLIVNFVVRNVKKMVPAFELPGAVRFNAAIGEGAGMQLKKADVGPEDIAFLQYTGGTTGVSKGAMLLHRNIIANMEQVSAWFSPTRDENEPMVIVTPLPLYHIYSLTVNCLFMLRDGGCNVLITNPRDIPGFIKELDKHRFTAMSGREHAVQRAAQPSGFRQARFLALAHGLARRHGGAEGGGRPLEARRPRWRSSKATASPRRRPVATTNPVDLTEFSGTIGLPVPSTEIAIRDDDENDLAVGKPGEICIAGPQVMKGYWQRPDETAKVMAKDGCLQDRRHRRDGRAAASSRIVDRKKDMILVSGFNVYPNEIEQVVAMMPGVLEVAAIGVPDEHSGEVPKLFIVKKDPALTEADVIGVLQGAAHRLQAAEVRRVPRRAAEDQRRQDPAPRAEG